MFKAEAELLCPNTCFYALIDGRAGAPEVGCFELGSG